MYKYRPTPKIHPHQPLTQSNPLSSFPIPIPIPIISPSPSHINSPLTHHLLAPHLTSTHLRSHQQTSNNNIVKNK